MKFNQYSNKKLILTNATSLEQEELGIINMPYEVFSLCHNPEKTDPLYFKTLCKKMNFKKENLLYIEHNNDALESARSFGINSFLFNGNYSQVRKYLIKNCHD